MRGNNLIIKKGSRSNDHLHNQVSDTPKLDKKKDSTTIRASIRAAEVIEDVKYTQRKKSALAALDEIIDVYLKYKDKEIED